MAVHLVGDSRSLERAFARSSKAGKKWQGDMTSTARRTRSALGGVAAGFGVAFGSATVIAGIKRSVSAASNLNEEISKSRVVFGDASQGVLRWSRTTANAFGISQREALGAASNFGLLFDRIGKGDQATGRMSRQFVQLAGDLASFFDVDTETALEKLRSGLAGEAEPLRQFGIFIDEATVKAEAYRLGIAKQGATLNQAQKLQARYSLIMRQSQKAQGDAARTATSWANIQRRLTAVIDDTAGKLGTTLLPMLREYGNRLVAWLSNARNVRRLQQALNDAMKVAVDIFRTLKGFIQGAVDALRPFAGLVKDSSDALKVLGAVYAGMRLAKVAREWKLVNIQAERSARAGGGAGGKRRVSGRGLAGAVGADPTGIGLAGFIVSQGIRQIPKWDDALKKVGATFQDDYVRARRLFGLRTDADKFTEAVERVGRAQAARAKGFGAREGPEGGFQVFDTSKRKRPRRGGGGGGGGGGAPPAGGLSAEERASIRNRIFDVKISRQLDRLQDLGLRKQLARLREIARELLARRATTKDAERRLNLEDQYLGVLRDQRSVQQEIAGSVRAANQALKERAEAIKSMALDRLQQRQTDVLNKRALADAKEQLRIARQIGGPKGIREAQRGVQDVNFDILRARAERAQPTITPGGKFALGGLVTINVHGVTDPAQVANKVAEVLQRRGRRRPAKQRGT